MKDRKKRKKLIFRKNVCVTDGNLLNVRKFVRQKVNSSPMLKEWGMLQKEEKLFEAFILFKLL